MLDRLDKNARDAIVNADASRRERGQSYIGIEHILHGLTLVPGSIATELLAELDVTSDRVKSVIDRLPKGSNTSEHAPFTPLVQETLKSAHRVAVDMVDNYVGTEHILLALMQASSSFAGVILTNLGINIDDLKVLVLDRRDKAPKRTPSVSVEQLDDAPDGTHNLVINVTSMQYQPTLEQLGVVERWLSSALT